MSTESITSGPTVLPTRTPTPHPLAPLSAAEIAAAADLVRSIWPAQTNLHFKVITLEEPPKAQVIPYLEAERSGKPIPDIPRKAFINYYLRNTVSALHMPPRLARV
jgi:primary-amine oxidase